MQKVALCKLAQPAYCRRGGLALSRPKPAELLVVTDLDEIVGFRDELFSGFRTAGCTGFAALALRQCPFFAISDKIAEDGGLNTRFDMIACKSVRATQD